MTTATLICRRCSARIEAFHEGEVTVVPAGWQRIVLLVAPQGRALSESLDGYGAADGYWLCPAHRGSADQL